MGQLSEFCIQKHFFLVLYTKCSLTLIANTMQLWGYQMAFPIQWSVAVGQQCTIADAKKKKIPHTNNKQLEVIRHDFTHDASTSRCFCHGRSTSRLYSSCLVRPWPVCYFLFTTCCETDSWGKLFGAGRPIQPTRLILLIIHRFLSRCLAQHLLHTPWWSYRSDKHLVFLYSKPR